jgi:hypothetical protein
MRYAHLAPEHLQEAKALNPLALMQSTATTGDLEPVNQVSTA